MVLDESKLRTYFLKLYYNWRANDAKDFAMAVSFPINHALVHLWLYSRKSMQVEQFPWEANFIERLVWLCVAVDTASDELQI